MSNCHILLVALPGQGQINPVLQLSKCLLKMGVNKVTFLTSLSATRRMIKPEDSLPQGLTIIPFSDGYDNGFVPGSDDIGDFFSLLSAQAMKDLIIAKAKECCPITRVIHTPFVSWVGQVAYDLGISSTLCWTQPAAVLDIYYYYFNGYEEKIRKITSCGIVELPGLPLLKGRDLPSFLLDSSPDVSKIDVAEMKVHFELLEKEENAKILVNTFDGLEYEALRAMKKLKILAIGPLVPSAFLDGKYPLDDSFGCDLLPKSKDYLKWLNSKPKGSLVYVAFGSYSELLIKQIEEIAKGLLQSKKPFLYMWVVRTSSNGEKLEENLSCKNELEKQGMVVPWCSQVEVLSHPCVGCFVTHCGWNSSLEGLVSGVPIVAIPLWTDQTTNAKFIQDVWKTGIRTTPNEEGIFEAGEIKRCLELVMDDKKRNEELRNKAKKWQGLARKAAKAGGSSYINLESFVNEIVGGAIKTNT